MKLDCLHDNLHRAPGYVYHSTGGDTQDGSGRKLSQWAGNKYIKNNTQLRTGKRKI